MKIKLRIIILLILIVCVGLLAFLLFFNITSSPQSTIYYDVAITNENIIIDAEHPHQFFHFRSYKTTYENGDLYIKFKGGYKIPFIKSSVNSNCLPIPNKYKEIKCIYLSDGKNHSNDRLIYKDGHTYFN